ncbi:hypothetical protein [Candidatus Accumulibacter phosphatis]|uniref:Putative secretion system X translation initiation factor n=1 Tax=Candidatus Accumulibacter phosphatis TaxID=327160 RepID=A0A5S4F5U0_9PROT|nr:hypothetical protein [Candidatus Accumulibacter phosphatis]TMQ76113.1 putative secretion system X translation initiation factor [Candidatus Accumulibacter phosphatis]
MNRRRSILWLLLVAAAWLALFGDRTPVDAPGEVVQAAAPRTGGGRPRAGASLPASDAGRPAGSAAEKKTSTRLEVAALVARAQLIPAAAAEQASREPRDLFPALSWLPPPPIPEKPAKPPPTAPPLPFVYLGKKLEAGQWEAYLGRGEEVFIVREGMTLTGLYRVQEIRPPTLTLLYLPLQQSQTIPIGGS